MPDTTAHNSNSTQKDITTSKSGVVTFSQTSDKKDQKSSRDTRNSRSPKKSRQTLSDSSNDNSVSPKVHDNQPQKNSFTPPPKQPNNQSQQFSNQPSFGGNANQGGGDMWSDPWGSDPWGSNQGGPQNQSKKLTPQERVGMIEKVYQDVLGRKPDTRDINYYKYSTLGEDEIVKQLLEGKEHKQLLEDGRDYKKMKNRAEQAETKSKMSEGQIKDQLQEFKHLTQLLSEKNKSIQQLRRKLKNPYSFAEQKFKSAGTYTAAAHSQLDTEMKPAAQQRSSLEESIKQVSEEKVNAQQIDNAVSGVVDFTETVVNEISNVEKQSQVQQHVITPPPQEEVEQDKVEEIVGETKSAYDDTAEIAKITKSLEEVHKNDSIQMSQEQPHQAQVTTGTANTAPQPIFTSLAPQDEGNGEVEVSQVIDKKNSEGNGLLDRIRDVFSI